MSEYLNSGFIHTATFEGIVQGVVVQITNEISSMFSILNTFFTFFKDFSSTLMQHL